jgi:hypothetical protein
MTHHQQQQQQQQHPNPNDDFLYDEASAEVELILGATKPKHLGQGLTSGLGYILRGAVGACGAMVVSAE